MKTIYIPFICLVQLLKAIIESNLRTVFCLVQLLKAIYVPFFVLYNY